ncbi:MAG: KH domain-containing protein [Oscillospiraceae bacterium]|jgi:spoIIIJ-associated protein|nr:KH domain-containing protein [Oscillospiraceae bacterium]
MEKIFTGKSFDETKDKASEFYAGYGVASFEIDYEIIEQPVKKLFGAKGEYRIRAIAEIPQEKTKTLVEAEAVPAPIVTVAPKSTEAAVVDKPKLEPKSTEAIAAYLDGILKLLGLSGYKITTSEKDGLALINIEGEHLGAVIGRRGETLDALQYLAILSSNRGDGKTGKSKLTIDCNGYRRKRRFTLENVAERTAEKVISTGKKVTLEAMNPYERRIIHSRVSKIDGVTSGSIGEEPFRKVVISADGKTKSKASPLPQSAEPARVNTTSPTAAQAQAPRKNDRRPAPSAKKRDAEPTFETSFERDYKKVGTGLSVSEETAEFEKNALLYGKIEL